MSKVQHYKNLNSNLDKIYNIIKDTINQEHNLKIVSEYKGFLNSVPLRSIIAGVAGLVIGGPIGLAAGATVGVIMAYEFEKKIWKKVTEAIKNESEHHPTLDSINHYHQ